MLLGTQQFHNTLDFVWRELGFHFVGVKYNTHEFNNPTWTDSFVRYNGDVERVTYCLYVADKFDCQEGKVKGA